jgi:hypothetical protein
MSATERSCVIVSVNNGQASHRRFIDGYSTHMQVDGQIQSRFLSRLGAAVIAIQLSNALLDGKAELQGLFEGHPDIQLWRARGKGSDLGACALEVTPTEALFCLGHGDSLL